MRSSLLAALLVIATPAIARDLPVPANKGWQHAATQLILPSKLDGLSRTKLIDQTDGEYDIAAEFADANTVATIFIFHPAVDNVPMWFERSEAQIYNRERYGDVAPNSAAPVPFAPPGSRSASGLRRIYTTSKSQFHTTGLAVMPLGDWLVAVRISGPSLSATALDARLSAVIAAMRWPADVADQPAATMIEACPTPLRFTGAKQQKPQGSDMLLSLLATSMASDARLKGEPGVPVRWCRDPASTTGYGVYRDLNTDRGYTLALNDAGRAMSVSPTLGAQTGKSDGYRVSLTDVDETTVTYPSFDHLPAPAQVIHLLDGPATGRAKGKTITLDAKSLGN